MEVGQGPNWGCSAKEKKERNDKVIKTGKLGVSYYVMGVEVG
jgi:hypothetical protein